MATTTTPINPGDLLTQALGGGIKLNIGGTMFGEAALVALIDLIKMKAATMDEGLMKRLDAVLVQQVEDMQSVNRHIWILLGVVKP